MTGRGEKKRNAEETQMEGLRRALDHLSIGIDGIRIRKEGTMVRGRERREMSIVRSGGRSRFLQRCHGMITSGKYTKWRADEK